MIKKIASIEGQIVNANISREEALKSEGATRQFQRLVTAVKKVAPRSDEFLYFACRAIHGLEKGCNCKEVQASLKNGTLFKEASKFCQCGQDGRWMNQNGDAFPMEELEQSYKTFVGRGLFVNHQSSDVQAIRGIILDAHLVPEEHGVDILVALDKVQYPELARQVQAGYLRDVSMGAAIQKSVCSCCGNEAITESDFCEHIRQPNKGRFHIIGGIQKKAHEINYGISFIEISCVSTGADPEAKIRQILASLNEVVESRNRQVDDIEKGSNISSVQIAGLQASLDKIANQLEQISKAGTGSMDSSGREESVRTNIIQEVTDLKDQVSHVQGRLEKVLIKVTSQGGRKMTRGELEARKAKRLAYLQGTEEPHTYPVDPIQQNVKNWEASKWKSEETGTLQGGKGKSSKGDDIALKQTIQRARLERRRLERRSYFQGGAGEGKAEITPSNLDLKGGDVRNFEVNKFNSEAKGQGGLGSTGGGQMKGDPSKGREELLRAKLVARFYPAAAKVDSYWTVFANDTPILRVTAGEAWGKYLGSPNSEDPSVSNYDFFADKSGSYGRELIKAIRVNGFEKTAKDVKGRTIKAAESDLAELGLGEEKDTDLDLGAESADISLGDEGGDKVDIDINMEDEGSPAGDVQDEIIVALDEIDNAAAKIRALNEGEEEAPIGEEEASLGGEKAEEIEGVEEGLGAAENELEGLGKELEKATASRNSSAIRKIAIIATQAIKDAKMYVRLADTLVTEAAKKKDPDKEKEKAEKAKAKEKAEKEKAKAKEQAEKAKAKEQAEKAKAKEQAEKAKAKEKAKRAEGAMDSSRPLGSLEQFEKMVEEDEPNGPTTTVEEEEEIVEAATNTTLLQRRAARRKFAADVYNVTPEYNAIKDAHPQGGNKTAIPGELIETVEEQQDADLAVANKQPRGEMTATQKATLQKAAAAGDSVAKQYLTEMFGEASFAEGLVKEYGKATKASVDPEALKIRWKRAYDVAMEMQDKGMIEGTKDALAQEAELLASLDDNTFMKMAKLAKNHRKTISATLAEQGITRTAGAIQVGQNESGKSNTLAVEIADELSELPWK